MHSGSFLWKTCADYHVFAESSRGALFAVLLRQLEITGRLDALSPQGVVKCVSNAGAFL